MKSLKESLGLARTGSSIDGMPKSAVGIIPHQEEERLNKLWIDIMKSEEAYAKLSCETGKYCSAIKEIQSTEEKLLKLLGDSNIGVHSPALRLIINEYLSVSVELKKLSDDASQTAQEATGIAPAQYHALYTQLDAFRKKRDLLIAEIERCQDKLDRLKIKGKRTTDVIVEKDRAVRQFKDLDARLRSEAETFHSLRIKFLDTCVQAAVHNQINYYGSSIAEFNKSIQESRLTTQRKERDFAHAVDRHLDNIRSLTIVDDQ